MRNIEVASVLAAALSGCGFGTSCAGYEPYDTTDVLETDVDADAYLAALDEDGNLSDEACLALCERYWGSEADACALVAENDDGSALLDCTITQTVYCEGRRPAGLRPARPRGGGLGRWFARAAHAEAASVPAFLRLRDDLRRHGAPAALERAALRAAVDEVRHARTMRTLALALGSEPERAVVDDVAARPLVEVAVENAVEGCVHETWAALVAMHQARRAANPGIRVAMARIARDEARHAQLAWDVNAWALGALHRDGRRAVRAARHVALVSLRPRYPATAALGLPSERTTAILLARISTIWR